MDVGVMQITAVIHTFLLRNWNVGSNCRSKPLWRHVEDKYVNGCIAPYAFP